MNQFYAGIGSRKTPAEVLAIMKVVAEFLDRKGWTLRSGGAIGADQAFESGAKENKEIYLATQTIPKWAFKMAESFHPNWPACSDYARKLHARNSLIMFGKKSPKLVHFVVCWTEGGLKKGGTGQAIRIADKFGIPVFDMGIYQTEDAMKEAFNLFWKSKVWETRVVKTEDVLKQLNLNLEKEGEMRITREWLEKQNACWDGKNWYVENCPEDSIEGLETLIKNDKLDWANWLIVRTMTYKQHVSYAVYAANEVLGIYEKKYPPSQTPRRQPIQVANNR